MKFDDLNENEVEQTFYFNFNKKEIAELLEFGRILRFSPRPGVTYLPLEEQLEKLSTTTEVSGLTNRQNNEQAYAIFENLLLDAYGVKGEDNVSFNKTDELRHYWSTHVAFPEMIFEFLQNPTLGGQFIENCLPKKMVAKAKAEMEAESKGQITGETLTEMVAEADRRQQDPATRIEPGLENAPEHIQEHARTLASGQDEAPYKSPETLTAQDIIEMDEVAFKKLDPQGLSRDAMMAAFRRKSQG